MISQWGVTPHSEAQKSLFHYNPQQQQQQEEEVKRRPLLDLSATAAGKKTALRPSLLLEIPARDALHFSSGIVTQPTTKALCPFLQVKILAMSLTFFGKKKKAFLRRLLMKSLTWSSVL